MVHFVGAGPGAADLITVRGQRLLAEADVIIYAGSLVNPALLEGAKPGCEIYNSAKMTLEEVIEVVRAAERDGKTTVRLHTGDPCLYGAHREQMDRLDLEKIEYEVVRGGGRASGGIHPAGRLPDGDRHPDGRADAGAGAGGDLASRGARRDHDDFPERGDA